MGKETRSTVIRRCALFRTPSIYLTISALVLSLAQENAILEDEPFSMLFLGRSLNFYLNDEFSARKIASEFCLRESEFDAEDAKAMNKSSFSATDFKNHVVAVRDLIENTVASTLGPDRIDAAFEGKDPVAFSFIRSVCSDFPKNHDMPYQRLLPRSSPLRIIDGCSPLPHRLVRIITTLPILQHIAIYPLITSRCSSRSGPVRIDFQRRIQLRRSMAADSSQLLQIRLAP